MKFIANTDNLINWNNVIELCQSSTTGDKNTVSSVVDRSEAEAVGNRGLLDSYRKVIGTWQQAGYDLNQIEWYDYYPGEHFDISVQDTFAKLIGAEPLRVFVSEVYPGVTIPYHWDVEDKEEEWLAEYGMLYRYVCCMDVPKPASVLMFDTEALTLNTQGDIYEWNHYKDFHSAVNGSDSPQYYFHFLGYKK